MNLAHFALQKLRILPSVLADMSQREKAFVYASIMMRVEEEKKQSDRLRTRGGRRR